MPLFTHRDPIVDYEYLERQLTAISKKGEDIHTWSRFFSPSSRFAPGSEGTRACFFAIWLIAVEMGAGSVWIFEGSKDNPSDRFCDSGGIGECCGLNGYDGES